MVVMVFDFICICGTKMRNMCDVRSVRGYTGNKDVFCTKAFLIPIKIFQNIDAETIHLSQRGEVGRKFV